MPPELLTPERIVAGMAVGACVVLAGWGALRFGANTTADELAHRELRDRVDRVAEVLEVWGLRQQATVRTWAVQRSVRAHTEALLALEPPSADALLAHPSQEALRDLFRPVLSTQGFRGYFVVRRDGTSVASSRDANVGTPNLVFEAQPEQMEAWLAGETSLSAPQPSDVPLRGEGGQMVPDAPTMFVGTPLRDAGGAVVGAFMFRIDPHERVLSTLDGVYALVR